MIRMGAKKIVQVQEARRLIGYYQHGMLDTMGMAEAIIESFRRGLLASFEADWMLKNLKQLKKLRLY